jgi:NAD-dependent dihydropyrimidine dehydrogenase PreA subunit/nitroreductase
MPVIDLEKCTRCLRCVKDCPANAITIEAGKIAEKCIHCGHCVAICPEMAISPDFGNIIPLIPNAVAAKDFRNLSAGIRTCRSYLDKSVPDEMLLELVENMKHYPSASNLRPVEVTIVRTNEKMQQLNDMTLDSMIRMISFITSPVISLFVRIFAPTLDVKKLKKYKHSFLKRRKSNNSLICHHAPAAILFHGPVSKTGMLEADANIWATYTSVYAHTMGLGTCFNGFIVKSTRKNSKQSSIIGIPSGHKVYASLLIGFPRVRYMNESGRKSPAVKFL